MGHDSEGTSADSGDLDFRETVSSEPLGRARLGVCVGWEHPLAKGGGVFLALKK